VRSRTLGDLIGALKASQSEIALSLARGNVATWEAYQRLVGKHDGLEEALTILNNLLKEDNENE
jgi:uncharacterized membrane protein (UPF0136 family)